MKYKTLEIRIKIPENKEAESGWEDSFEYYEEIFFETLGYIRNHLNASDIKDNIKFTDGTKYNSKYTLEFGTDEVYKKENMA